MNRTPSRFGKKFKIIVMNNVNITSKIFLFLILVIFMMLYFLFKILSNIIPRIKFIKPKIVLMMTNIDEFPSLPTQLKATQLVTKVSVGILGMILKTKSNPAAISMRLIPMNKENVLLLKSAVVGRRIINSLSSPRAKTAIGRKMTVIFCKAVSQNSNGVA